MEGITYAEILVGSRALEALERALIDISQAIEDRWLDEEGYLHLTLGEGTQAGDVAALLKGIAPSLGLELGRESDGTGEVVLSLPGTYRRIPLDASALSEAGQALDAFKRHALPLTPEQQASIRRPGWPGTTAEGEPPNDTPDEAQEWAPIEGPDPCYMPQESGSDPDCEL